MDKTERTRLRGLADSCHYFSDERGLLSSAIDDLLDALDVAEAESSVKDVTISELERMVAGMADRIAKQADQLAMNAERARKEPTMPDNLPTGPGWWWWKGGECV